MTIHFLAANEPLIVDGKPRLGYFDDALPLINTPDFVYDNPFGQARKK